MRILFLSQIVPYPPHGGVLQRGFNLIREIHKKNEVHLLAFVHPEVLPSPDHVAASREQLSEYCAQIEYFPLWPKRSIYHRYASLCMGLFSPSPFSVIAHRSVSFLRRIREIVASERIDLIHYDTIALAQFHDPARGLPTVVTHHNIESQLMQRRSEKERNILARWYLKDQTRKIKNYEVRECPRFDKNIVVSASDGKVLRDMICQVRTSVVPNGVDIEYFKPKSFALDSTSLIYTGGMNMFANKDAVMYFCKEIWPLVRAKVRNAIFYAVGQDPPRELLELSRNEPGIKVTGYLDDIRPQVDGSAVYVVPLRVGGGTRLKVVDAMAMGKAIVSTTIGCEGIEATPGEHLLVADDPVHFAELTVELLNSPEKRIRLGEAARRLVQVKYSWSTIGDKLQRTYEEAVRRA